MGSISPLGSSEEEVRQNLFSPHTFIQKNNRGNWVGGLNKDSKEKIKQLIKQNSKFKLLDRSVLLAIYASTQAWNTRKDLGQVKNLSAGVNIGSSRGATDIFEDKHKSYLQHPGELPASHTSPTTTLGAVSSWVGKELNINGPAFSHSVTCSTSLYAIGNAMAWVKAGFSDLFIAGGAEAPLTPFTIDQMKALKIYSDLDQEYPSLPLGTKNKNTMVLGEGAASFVIESQESAIKSGLENWVNIDGIGFANEKMDSPTSISKDGVALSKSMKIALGQDKSDVEVDLIITHAPGTKKGDDAELKAIESVFGNRRPNIISTKWKTGHLLGASSALAIEQAIHMLKAREYPSLPYPNGIKNEIETVNKIMINSIGFGGNSASIILSLNN